MKPIYISILTIIFLLQACNFGAGTHGSIESYYFRKTNNEIVLMVDKFLLENPDYLDYIDSTSGYGWVHIKIPISKKRYGFRIGGNSEIVLIQASNIGESYKYGRELWFFQENRFKKDFKKNFVDLLNDDLNEEQKVYREPFTLTINTDVDTTLWPEYFIGVDTTFVFPLPQEFDTIKNEYFKDLVEFYSDTFNKDIYMNQYYDFFRLNQQCTGHLRDSIIVTRFYRHIGQKFNFDTFLETKNWNLLIDSSNTIDRFNAYKKIREERIKNNYKETDVNSKYSEEFWMKKEKNGS